MDAADDRQYRFHTDKLERDDKYRNRRLTHRMKLTWVGAGVGTGAVILVLCMAFWGGDGQRDLAAAIARDAISVVGLVGLGFLLGRIYRR